MNNAHSGRLPNRNKSTLLLLDRHNLAQGYRLIAPSTRSINKLLSNFFQGHGFIMTKFRLALLTTTALTVAQLAGPLAHAQNANAPVVVAQAAPPGETGPDGKPKQPPKGPPPKAAPPPAAAPPPRPAPPAAAPPPPPPPPHPAAPPPPPPPRPAPPPPPPPPPHPAPPVAAPAPHVAPHVAPPAAPPPPTAPKPPVAPSVQSVPPARLERLEKGGPERL
jgi:hypothetical protein